MYGAPDIKSRIYNALWECMHIAYTTSYAYQGKRLATGPFALSNTEVACAKRMMENFATNQLMGSWKKHDYKAVMESRMSRKLGIRVSATKSKLTLYLNRTKVTYDKNAKLKNTTELLPFCVALLDSFYKTAKEYK